MNEIRDDFITDYDALADEWWDPRGSLAPLGWIAAARARFVPRASRAGARLLDVACGGGLFGPHVAGKGYRVIGVDLSAKSLDAGLADGLEGVGARLFVAQRLLWPPSPPARPPAPRRAT